MGKHHPAGEKVGTGTRMTGKGAAGGKRRAKGGGGLCRMKYQRYGLLPS